jgi:hypothetical protein
LLALAVRVAVEMLVLRVELIMELLEALTLAVAQAAVQEWAV